MDNVTLNCWQWGFTASSVCVRPVEGVVMGGCTFNSPVFVSYSSVIVLVLIWMPQRPHIKTVINSHFFQPPTVLLPYSGRSRRCSTFFPPITALMGILAKKLFICFGSLISRNYGSCCWSNIQTLKKIKSRLHLTSEGWSPGNVQAVSF